MNNRRLSYGLLLTLTTALVAACGPRGNAPAQGVAANDIARLATPEKEEHDPMASARPQNITSEELGRAALLGSGCRFSHEDSLLLAEAGADAIVKIEGSIRHLRPTAPLTGSGGFFEDGEIAVSIGREHEAVENGGVGSWPAQMGVTNRRTHARVREQGIWTCGP